MRRFFNRKKTVQNNIEDAFDGLFTKEEKKLLSKYHIEGNDEAELKLITAAQERARKTLEESTGVDATNMIIDLGQDSPMTNVINHVLRVLDFDRNDTTIDDGKVKAKSRTKPYGYLLTESPIFNLKARLPIIHETDFRLADSVFSNTLLAPYIESDELLVTYSPKKVIRGGLSGSPHHVLHFILVPCGTLDKYYSLNNDIHFSKPNPQILFGTFIYEGDVKVEVITEPRL